MKKKIFSLVVMVFLLAWFTQVPPAAGQMSDLTGEYQVNGANPNGSPYTGTARIWREGDIYRMSWNIGGSAFNGEGALTGNTLSIRWGEGDSRNDTVVYEVTEGGVLKGSWAGGQGRETLTRIK